MIKIGWVTAASGTEDKAVQPVQTVQLTQGVSESEYHLNSMHAVEPMHSFLSPPQCDTFVYLVKLPPQDNCSECSDSIH